MNVTPETAANTAVMFTAEDWALLRSLAKAMTEYVEASNKRQDASEARIEEAHKRLDAQNTTLVKWAAFGMGGAFVLGILGWLAKFFLRIG